jgi:hypothetical protein
MDGEHGCFPLLWRTVVPADRRKVETSGGMNYPGNIDELDLSG